MDWRKDRRGDKKRMQKKRKEDIFGEGWNIKMRMEEHMEDGRTKKEVHGLRRME